MIRISAAAPRTPTALAELVCLRRRLRVGGDLLRGVVGLGRLRLRQRRHHRGLPRDPSTAAR